MICKMGVISLTKTLNKAGVLLLSFTSTQIDLAMREGEPGPHFLKPTKLPIPPFILRVGSILWELLDVVGRIDFILRVEDETFAAVLQAFVSYVLPNRRSTVMARH
jgi:hypothetical protein